MKKWASVHVAPKIGGFLLRIIGHTLRFRIHDQSGDFSKNDPRGHIFAFWHNRIAVLPFLYQKFYHGRKIAVMISRSRDGQMITDIAAEFGVEAVRGSTSKNGISAFRQILKELVSKGKDIGITPDGPRGPRYKVQPGIIHLAQISGYPIIPITYHLKWKIEFKSWDRFQFPIPFSRCDVHTLPKLEVPENATKETIEKLCAELESRLGT